MEDELEPRLGQQLHISKPDDLTDGSLFLKPIPGYVVAVMEPIERQAEFAALFMAAPDLLAALENVVASAQAECSGSLANAILAGQDALAKAKGGE